MRTTESIPLLTLRRTVFMLLAVCLTAAMAVAQMPAQATVSATPDRPSAKPGDTVTLNITIDVIDGFHAQSHTPSEPNYIPLTVKLTDAPGLRFGEPVYPAGTNETYPNLGTLNVYTGRVVVTVPVTIKPDAAGGPTTLAGTVRYQACNDTACFPPKNAKFTTTINVEAAGEPTPATAPGSAVPAPTPSATAPAATADVATNAPTTAPAQNASREAQLADDAYVAAFALAFLAGIIFNAVPCVLPVVPLKIVGFYEAAQHDRRKCFLLGLAFSAGLVASFAVLALFIVVLKSLTWGGLFQQTWFTVTIVTVLLVMAASQFGLFTFNLPVAAYGLTPRHDTYAGNAMFGVLTAALSTPCTIGPFSAVLIWALRQPPSLGALSVIVVGCGMASPYLVLSAFPQVVRKFPRTGPVGEIIKQTLAFLVLATAVYFARPLIGRFIPGAAFWWTLFAVVAIAMVFLVARTVTAVGTRRAIAISSSVAAVVAAVAFVFVFLLTKHPYDWRPYSDQALAEARQAGRTVVVDFTADWCGNCQWLEAWVINDASVVEAVQSGQVVMLRADVTHGDEPGVPLKDKLVSTGEIPLTLVYRPGSEDPALLKGVYSKSDLLTALGGASTGSE